MLPRLSVVLVSIFGAGVTIAQTPPPPPPPGPPQFMTMRGYPLSCFDKVAFEDDGLEFFVCQGGGGISGVRKKNDPTQTVWVRDPDIAQNLNMKVAKSKCQGKKFAVTSLNPEFPLFGYLCDGKEIRQTDRFRATSQAEWKKYQKYLN